ncbi:MAG: glycosyltransferase, partial [Lachnospiraceae bacterium]|nr:glycosyltransferase [Lachnospiraceae bacterium]
MKLSVVINTYNRAESLKKTLESLLYQSVDDFEV